MTARLDTIHGGGKRDQRSPLGLAAMFAGAGVAHFVKPGMFESLIPEPLGSPRAWVFGSGVAELAMAALLLDQRRRRLAGYASAALLIGVFPANIKMALMGGDPQQDGFRGSAAFAMLRLPLQVPLVLWALQVAKSADS